MSVPEWSVIVPTSGRPATLARCLAALEQLEAPARGFEIVVAYDSASDRGFDTTGRVDVRRARVGGRGPAAARNAGAGVARGRWLAFTDDDCTPEPGWLRALEAAPGFSTDAALGGRVANAVADNLLSVASQAVLDTCHGHFNASGPRFYASSNIAVPAAGYEAVGGFDEAFLHAEDREFWDRWLASGRELGHAPEAVVWHHRAHTLSDLCRQHAGYGRGAVAFHRRRGSTPVPSLPFYRRLARRAWAEPQGRRGAVLALAGLTQAAMLAGYVVASRRDFGAAALPVNRTADNGQPQVR